jgi:hypothetical protein
MKWRLALAAFVIILGGYVFSGCIADRRAEQLGIKRTEALLAGDPEVQLASVEISCQKRRVRCSDPAALRYLEGCFRDGDQRPRFKAGCTYLLRLRFAGGGSVEAATYWSEGGFCLYMPYQETDTGEEPRVRVVFKPPMPQQVAEMLVFLDRPWQEVKGMVLVVEPGSIRREFDRSLVAE